MNRFNRIQSLVQESIKPLHLELENESSQHSVPPGSETHFKILVVSDVFNEISRIDRQRKIHALLDQEFKTGLRALTIRALTPLEWKKTGDEEFVSPPCHSETGAKTSNS